MGYHREAFTAVALESNLVSLGRARQLSLEGKSLTSMLKSMVGYVVNSYSTQCGSGEHSLSPASEEGPAISPLLSPDIELGWGKTLNT